MRLIALFLLSSIVASSIQAEAAIEFKVIPCDEPVTTFSMTEDGLWLILAHKDSDHLTIWDVKQGGIVKTIACDSPSWIMSRGGKVFVANDGKGQVSVYTEGSWSMDDQLAVSSPKIAYLSAAGGKHFDGKILVTAGKYTDHQILELDATKDRCRLVRKEVYMSVATVSHSGDDVFVQDEFSFSPSAEVIAYSMADLLDGGHAPQRGLHQDTPFLTQNQDCSYWVGGSTFYMGSPPEPVSIEGPVTSYPDMPHPLHCHGCGAKARCT